MDAIGFPLSTVLAFLILAGGALLGDMLVSRRITTLTLSDAITRSVAYILVACLFGLYVWHAHGADAGSRFFAGFLMEKALSVDNLMVFAAIFTYFGVKSTQQRKLLQYGIIGAVVLRFIFVAGGMGLLLTLGRATEVLFGILVAWSAWAILQGQEKEEVDYFDAWYIKAAHAIWPVYPRPSDALFVLEKGRWHITAMFLCLLTIEASDILFSFDSVPAVIGITQDPLLVYTAVIFAILGLRALYFVLESLRSCLVHLDKAVAVILVFIGSKLIGHALFEWHVSPLTNVVIVLGCLTVGVLASLADRPLTKEVA